jgi:hypothetical protein
MVKKINHLNKIMDVHKLKIKLIFQKFKNNYLIYPKMLDNTNKVN